MKSRFHIHVRQTQKVKKLQDVQPRLYHRFIEGKRLGCAAFFQTLECHGFAQLDGHSGNTLQPCLGGLTVWPRGLSLTLKIGR